MNAKPKRQHDRINRTRRIKQHRQSERCPLCRKPKPATVNFCAACTEEADNLLLKGTP